MFGLLLIALGWTLRWLWRTFSVRVLGAQSSSANCWLSWLYGESSSSTDASFVEDRTYKLLIVDSIMNLFRE